MVNYYNEFNPKAAAALRQLIADGLIPEGVVDERSITDVTGEELRGFTQCHFFAGIGGWSLALQLAGWPSTRPVWTGSCPCQPFSVAGKQNGKDDERHLWPVWFRLIQQCNPSVVFGEQVAAAVAKGWLDEVATDMESCGYSVGSAVLPACSVGAPHRRDRLWFVASDNNGERGQRLGTEKVQGIDSFSWCKDVRSIEDLRGRSDIPEPLVCSNGNGIYDGLAELHAFGNAIVPQVGAEFIKAYMDIQQL
jgi:DNA (cytosine-5)-methyltransferase 1